jgi:hypothetical protein
VSESARELLAEATRWLLKQEDPGFGYGIRGGGQPDWERAGFDLLAREAARPAEQCGVVDAGLCHGSMGLAHIYNRAFQATGRTPFADAARKWAERALLQRQPGAGIGGFQSWRMDWVRGS